MQQENLNKPHWRATSLSAVKMLISFRFFFHFSVNYLVGSQYAWLCTFRHTFAINALCLWINTWLLFDQLYNGGKKKKRKIKSLETSIAFVIFGISLKSPNTGLFRVCTVPYGSKLDVSAGWRRLSHPLPVEHFFLFLFLTNTKHSQLSASVWSKQSLWNYLFFQVFRNNIRDCVYVFLHSWLFVKHLPLFPRH